MKVNTNQNTVRVYVHGKWRTIKQEDVPAILRPVKLNLSSKEGRNKK